MLAIYQHENLFKATALQMTQNKVKFAFDLKYYSLCD